MIPLYRANAVLAPGPRAAIRADTRRIVITGATSWIGRATLALLHEALGREQFDRRIVAFGSAAGSVEVDDGIALHQRRLRELARLPKCPTLLLHFAFVTKDRVATMDTRAYAAVNRAIGEAVGAALEPIGVDRLFLASSGAAAAGMQAGAPADLSLYGALKREDEARFTAWAQRDPPHRHALIARIFNLSGPYFNKPETYALAGFATQAVAGHPIVIRAPHRVMRGYVALRELIGLVIAALLAPDCAGVTRFATGGEPVELAQLAALVARAVPGAHVARAAFDAAAPADDYCGDHAAYAALLARHGLAHLPLAAQVAETLSWLRAPAAYADCA